MTRFSRADRSIGRSVVFFSQRCNREFQRARERDLIMRVPAGSGQRVPAARSLRNKGDTRVTETTLTSDMRARATDRKVHRM